MTVHEKDSMRKLSFCLSSFSFFLAILQLLCNSDTRTRISVIVKTERSSATWTIGLLCHYTWFSKRQSCNC